MPFHRMDYPDPHASSQGPSSHQLPPSDAELRHQIQARILADPWVHGDRVQVAVNQGVVTLMGTVDSLEAKRAADDVPGIPPGCVRCTTIWSSPPQSEPLASRL